MRSWWNSWWSTWQTAWRTWQAENEAVASDFARENLRRLRLASGVMVVINLLHVLVFAASLGQGTAVEQLWRQGVVWAHLVMACMAVAWGSLAHVRLGRQPKARADAAVVAFGVGSSILFALSLTLLDQLVTPSITPLLVVSVALGTVLLIRPGLGTWVYLGVLGLAVWGLQLWQPDPALRLTNQVNSLTASVLGWLVATLQWRQHTRSTLLQRELAQRNDELARGRVELETLARRDALTGLLNRRECQTQAEAELARAQRRGASTGLVLVDLDHFKAVNDAHGHPVGDEVLVHVARLLRDGVRRTDLVARIGGEEFMLILPDTAPPAAQALAEKLRAGLAASPWVGRGLHLPLSASLGVVVAGPGEAAYASCYAAADAALYAAKHAGRNRVILAALSTA